MGNGAKAAQKRERNAKNGAGTAKSQLKQNEQAKTIICSICRSSFLCTANEKTLAEHVSNKHAGKTVKDCFPSFVPK